MPDLHSDPRDMKMEQGSHGESHEEEVTFIDLLIMLAKRKWLIVGLVMLAGVTTTIATLFMDEIYTASTKVFPPHQSPSAAAAMLGQLGALAGAAGGALSLKSPNEVYVAILKSRTVADNLIQRFDLDRRYTRKLRSDTRKKLEDNVQITVGKDGLITIDVDDIDPKFAAQLANAYVDELMKLTKILAVTEASQRRLFFEQQFLQAKENVAKAEIAARQALERGGLVKVDEQGRGMIETSARLRAQISVKEVQIGAMRVFAADLNPDLQLAQTELTAMRAELAKIEGARPVKGGEHPVDMKGVENIRVLRDLKYYETVYELLARQYEVAKIDEAKDPSVIQVLDKAVVPDMKSKPKRRLLVLAVVIIAAVLGMIVALACECGERMLQDSRGSERLNLLRRYVLRV